VFLPLRAHTHTQRADHDTHVCAIYIYFYISIMGKGVHNKVWSPRTREYAAGPPNLEDY